MLFTLNICGLTRELRAIITWGHRMTWIYYTHRLTVWIVYYPPKNVFPNNCIAVRGVNFVINISQALEMKG